MSRHKTLPQKDPIVTNVEAACETSGTDMYMVLQHACIALNATAEKFYKKDTTNGVEYANFINRYSWILSATSQSVDFEKTKFGDLGVKIGGKLIKNPTVGDIVYFIRTKVAHGKKVPETLGFSEDNSFSFGKNGTLHMPQSFAWGLIFICVFAEINDNIKSDGNVKLIYVGPLKHKPYSFNPIANTITKFEFLVKDSWGKEKELKKFYSQFDIAKIDFSQFWTTT